MTGKNVREIEWCCWLRPCQALGEADISSKLPGRILKTSAAHRDATTECPAGTIASCSARYHVNHCLCLQQPHAHATVTCARVSYLICHLVIDSTPPFQAVATVVGHQNLPACREVIGELRLQQRFFVSPESFRGSRNKQEDTTKTRDMHV